MEKRHERTQEPRGRTVSGKNILCGELMTAASGHSGAASSSSLRSSVMGRVGECWDSLTLAAQSRYERLGVISTKRKAETLVDDTHYSKARLDLFRKRRAQENARVGSLSTMASFRLKENDFLDIIDRIKSAAVSRGVVNSFVGEVGRKSRGYSVCGSTIFGFACAAQA